MFLFNSVDHIYSRKWFTFFATPNIKLSFFSSLQLILKSLILAVRLVLELFLLYFLQPFFIAIETTPVFGSPVLYSVVPDLVWLFNTNKSYRTIPSAGQCDQHEDASSLPIAHELLN